MVIDGHKLRFENKGSIPFALGIRKNRADRAHLAGARIGKREQRVGRQIVEPALQVGAPLRNERPLALTGEFDRLECVTIIEAGHAHGWAQRDLSLASVHRLDLSILRLRTPKEGELGKLLARH